MFIACLKLLTSLSQLIYQTNAFLISSTLEANLTALLNTMNNIVANSRGVYLGSNSLQQYIRIMIQWTIPYTVISVVSLGEKQKDNLYTQSGGPLEPPEQNLHKTPKAVIYQNRFKYMISPLTLKKHHSSIHDFFIDIKQRPFLSNLPGQIFNTILLFILTSVFEQD